MKFAANISFMFTEFPFKERFAAAKNAGFKAVESGFPNLKDITAEEIIEAKIKSGIDQVLVNLFTGDTTKKQLGCANIPGREQEFAEKLDLTIQYAKAMNCRKIHLMAGFTQREEQLSLNDQFKSFKRNIGYATQRLAQENIMGLLEPINPYSVPGYFMNSYDYAVQLVKEFDSPNLRLQLDIFHCQHIRGNITHSIDDLLKYVGHVQIAQVPHRGEPGSTGELEYKYILQYLKNKGYNDWVGLEYYPTTAETIHSLKWIKQYGYEL